MSPQWLHSRYIKIAEAVSIWTRVRGHLHVLQDHRHLYFELLPKWIPVRSCMRTTREEPVLVTSSPAGLSAGRNAMHCSLQIVSVLKQTSFISSMCVMFKANRCWSLPSLIWTVRNSTPNLLSSQHIPSFFVSSPEQLSL